MRAPRFCEEGNGFPQMILSLMYMGIGFLFAALTLVAVIPSIHDRAVRLTTSRLRATLPQSMEEIQANKDLLRAEFAVSTCRVEKWLEQLKRKSADQVVGLGKRADVINRLKVDRGTLKVELDETNDLLEALKADKNSLRAQFAISTCRVEKSLEQLKRKSTDQVVELDKRAGLINRLKIERDA